MTSIPSSNPPIMNYSRFINQISAARYLSPLRKLSEIQIQGGPSLIALGTGAPNAGQFPFEKITVNTRDGYEFALEGRSLNAALSYGASPGLSELIDWISELQRRVHNPPMRQGEAGVRVIVLPGSQDGLSKCLEMLVQPGDHVLIEEPAYPGSMAVLKPFGVKFLAVQSDENGMKPESLRELLSPWSGGGDGSMPKLMLVQPNHCNPTGASLPLERRREIYQIAREYDLVIIEDDPYFHLTYGGKPPASFLSMDDDGRVLRLDSFSKVMSAGIRIGVLTGPQALVNRVMMHVASSSLQCSTLSQVIVLNLLRHWGHDGFLQHASRVADFYHSQCKKMLTAAQTHLTGLAEWYVPSGGMFLWLNVVGVKDTYKMITEKAAAKQVVLAPGSMFMLDDKKPSSYLRASYSAATQEQMNRAFQRLADLIREEQHE